MHKLAIYLFPIIPSAALLSLELRNVECGTCISAESKRKRLAAEELQQRSNVTAATTTTLLYCKLYKAVYDSR